MLAQVEYDPRLDARPSLATGPTVTVPVNHGKKSEKFNELLYNVYCTIKTTKELWESLDKKYKIEDVGAKKFLVGRFLEYKMVDSKSVISQVQELQVILHEIHSEGMVVSESFQVAYIIEKPSSAWKDFKNYLKHKRKEMNVEELIVRLRIEEDNKSSKRGFNPVCGQSQCYGAWPKLQDQQEQVWDIWWKRAQVRTKRWNF
ncbi:zinc knuckle (CCHC-type) family protein [Abeliophyllum distichum]|uniref:Zinc knuckle (CCHC-type) family protein n=1 Tax=Abeliophyllum distichum TaxID=126358 RepID=A0ABD1Q4T5_9LAMI